MSRRQPGSAERGSKKWLQILVNQRPEVIDAILSEQLCLAPGQQIHWLSPLQQDRYAEYRDGEVLEKLDISLDIVPLHSFWPHGGPAWDALAKTDRGDLLLLEARSHIPELVSEPAKASERELAQIRRTLERTKRFFGSRSPADWSVHFYQYTSCLSHLYLFRQLNGLPAYLVYLYFLNDEEMHGPSTEAQWQGALELLETFLDIRGHRLSHYVLQEFIDIKNLELVE
jgi:hypothetical protein